MMRVHQLSPNPLWFVVAVVLAVVAVPLGTGAQERVGNATAGISLVPPPGWHVTSMQDVLRNRSQLRPPDAELEAGLQRATAPLFAFSKYQEPYPTLNPTVQVVLRPRPRLFLRRQQRCYGSRLQPFKRRFPTSRSLSRSRTSRFPV